MERWLIVVGLLASCGGRTELDERAHGDAADRVIFECGDAGAICTANAEYCAATSRGPLTNYVCTELPAGCTSCDCIAASQPPSSCSCTDDQGRITLACGGR